MVEQKSEKARVEIERRSAIKLTDEQKICKSMKRPELMMKDGVMLNLLLRKSLKRLELKLRGVVSLNILQSKSLKRL